MREQKIVVKHIDIELMIMDPLTKGLRPICFHKHGMNMGVLALLMFLVNGSITY